MTIAKTVRCCALGVQHSTRTDRKPGRSSVELAVLLRALLAVLSLAACASPPHDGATVVPASRVRTPRVERTRTEPPASAVPVRVRSIEGITEYRLANGLQVLLYPDPTQSTVTVSITYLVGSRLEGYGETGMAHLLEHMLFKGTPTYRDVMSLLHDRGAQANGSTWTDRTNYYETLPATQDNLAFALDLEADRMIHALISPGDLETELAVVRNEFEVSENDPLAVLEQRVVAAAYLWHNYGKDSLGSRADIERVPVSALRSFYERYYQPDNAVLVVSGQFDTSFGLAKIAATFGAIPRPARVLAPTYTVEPVQDGERSVVLRRNGDLHALGVAYHTVGAAAPEFPAVQAAVDVLTRRPSGRLYKRLVEPKLAAKVAGWQYMFRDPFLALFSAELRDGRNLERVEQIMLSEIEQLGSRTTDDVEIARWRVATLKELELAMADSPRFAVQLSELAALGDWRMLFAYRDRVAKVTAADVRRIAQMFFKQSNRTSGRFIPTKVVDRAPLAEVPDVARAVRDIESGEVVEQGEPFAATLESIEARTVRAQLEPGIKAVFLPKKTRGGKVLLELALHWGDDKALQGKQAIATLAAAMLSRGTDRKTFQEIEDLEGRLKSRVWIHGVAAGLTLTIEALRDTLPATLELAAEVLTRPTFPDQQLELVKQEQLAQLERQLTDPSALAWIAMAQVMSPWPKTDPRYAMSPADMIAAIKRVTASDLRAFYRDLAGAGHAELVVVGDFDPAGIAAQVGKRLGAWTSRKPYMRLVDKPSSAPGTRRSIHIADKEMTQLVVGHDLAMRDTDPDYPAWLLVGQILGGYNSSRLWQRLREHEGLSYGPGAATFAGAQDEAGGIRAFATVAPQNLAKAKASMLEEITRLATGRVRTDELQRAKDAWLRAQDTNLSSDTWLVQMLRIELSRGRTMAFAREQRAKVQAVTAAEVERVAKKYLRPSDLVVVDAGDLDGQAGADGTNRPARAPP